MDFSKLRRGDQIVLIAGALLVIDLLFLPWHHISVPRVLGYGGGSVNRTAVQSPNSFYGVLALLIVLVMVAQVVVSRFTSAKLPDLPVSWGQVHLIAGIAVLALLLLKLLVETTALGFGCYLGILLAAAVAYGGFLIFSETSGSSARGLPPR